MKRPWSWPKPEDYVTAWRLLAAVSANEDARRELSAEHDPRRYMVNEMREEIDDPVRVLLALATLAAAELREHGETADSLRARIALATLRVESGVRP